MLTRSKNILIPHTGISISPSVAEVRLQDLVDHTTTRLISSPAVKEKLQQFSDGYELTLIYKWGCDGSSNHARYKQGFREEFEDGDIKEYSDSHIFASSIVPLRLTARKAGSTTEEIVWDNTLPSSINLCRPIKLIFAKESAELTSREVESMERQISLLIPTVYQSENIVFSIVPKMIFCMVDTKVVNDVTGTNTQSCYICGRSGKNLNAARREDDPNDPAKFKFGMSPLHAYIRSMEMFLKISFR